MGKNKSEVIAADVPPRAVDVHPDPAVIPAAGSRRCARVGTRRGATVIDTNRYLRWPISGWPGARVPDMWNAFAESLPLAKAVLGCCPRLHCSSGPQRAQQR
jgi:hypothetical protein